MSEELEPFASKVRTLFEQVIGALPPGTARLDVSRSANCEPILQIVPANFNAARISAHIEEPVEVIDLTIGEAFTLEFPADLPAGRVSTLERIRMFVQAAIEGDIQEEISQGLIGRPGKKIRTYEPYIPAPVR